MKQLLERVPLEVSPKEKPITTPSLKDKEILNEVILYFLQMELSTFVNKNCWEITYEEIESN